MSCISALHTQLVTFLSAPHEILLFRHRVFKEYAKIAVGPDFIHTLPSFIVLAAMIIFLWRNPPKIRCFTVVGSGTMIFRLSQVLASWIAVNAILWLWLVCQRVLYCSIWSHWSYQETEYREIVVPWWQRVWSSYYPPPLKPSLFSAGLISWIISMAISIGIFGCATSKISVQRLPSDIYVKARNVLGMTRHCMSWSLNRSRDAISVERLQGQDDSEISSVCDDCRSDLSADVTRGTNRRSSRSMSYGRGWTPRPTFPAFKDNPRKYQDKPSRASATIAGSTIRNRNEDDDDEKLSPRQLRHRRGCHTVVPSNSSDKSSGC